MSADDTDRPTYRERRAARAERLRGWAGGREAKAEATYDRARQIADMIPLGQPVLSGHHSEGRHRADLARRDNGFRRSHEHATKAAAMRSRADNIDAAAAHAIYSDDPDAIERLAEKLAGLEAERDRVKAFNRSARAGAPDLSLLTPRQAQGLAMDHPDARARRKGALPAYVLANLSGTITTTRKRLAALQAKAGQAAVLAPGTAT